MLRKPTTWTRATVTEIPRIILPPEEGAPEGSERCVHIFVPDTPVEIALDQHPEGRAAREAQWPAPPPGKTYKLRVMPFQSITARATEGLSEISVLVEYV